MVAAQVLQLTNGTPAPRVLVVDDVESNRILLSRLLVPAGFEVEEADNGEEAVDLARTWQPHAVLMDVQMPLLDGLAATRQIKSTHWGNAIVVIIVSGNLGETNLADALAAGAIAFIAKPFLDAEILAALGSALSLRYVGG